MADQGHVETLVVLQPVAVDTGSPDRVGRLVIANGLLVAVLVQIDDAGIKNHGSWFLEVGLGRLRGLRPSPFDSLEDATRWLRRQIKPD